VPTPDASTTPTPRREFLGQFAASAIVLAGAACATPAVTANPPVATPAPSPAANPSSTPLPVTTHWDDSWFAHLTAKHKAVFDSPQIDDGLVLANASGYIRGMRDAIGAGPNDVQAVIIIRHAAIAMAFNDAMWAKYEIGKDKKIKAPRSEDWVTRNPYLGGSTSGGSGRGGAAAAPDRAQPNFTWLAANGNILLGCDLATRNYSGVIARAFKVEQATVYEDFKANLIPGMILQPTGVYAALRAQEAGCNYIRST
jgi:hypothetical protein